MPMCCRTGEIAGSSVVAVAVGTIGLLGTTFVALMNHLGITQRKPMPWVENVGAV